LTPSTANEGLNLDNRMSYITGIRYTNSAQNQVTFCKAHFLIGSGYISYNFVHKLEKKDLFNLLQ